MHTHTHLSTAMEEVRGSSGEGDGGTVDPEEPAMPNTNFPPVNTVRHFFRQKRAMNFQNYIKLKQEEKTVVLRHRAAIYIQAIYRGWLVRTNLNVMRVCAIKIQALWRRAIARKRYIQLSNDKQERSHQAMLNKMATKIQALFRGYMSRKNKLNFKKYKKLMERNKKLKKSIDRINDLEEALFRNSSIRKSLSQKSSSNGSNEFRFEELDELAGNPASDNESQSQTDVMDAAVRSLEQILENKSFEELDTVSPSRLDEFLSQAQVQVSTPSSDTATSSGSPTSSATMSGKDSVKNMFPRFPDNAKLVRPDSEKLDLLKNAIGILRAKIKSRELEKLYKIHFLMRTAVVPGVYSDIYTNQLTEIEQKLKSLKYYCDLPRLPPNKSGTPLRKLEESSNSRPGTLEFESEDQMLQKIYDFKLNYFQPGMTGADGEDATGLELGPDCLRCGRVKDPILQPLWKR